MYCLYGNAKLLETRDGDAKDIDIRSTQPVEHELAALEHLASSRVRADERVRAKPLPVRPVRVTVCDDEWQELLINGEPTRNQVAESMLDIISTSDESDGVVTFSDADDYRLCGAKLAAETTNHKVTRLAKRRVAKKKGNVAPIHDIYGAKVDQAC
jgi:hypothetical protein